MKREKLSVKERLFWAYANLAMAQSALSKEQSKYLTVNYMVRAKLYKGLIDGTMNIGTFFDDEKIKLNVGLKCNYCGDINKLSYDHLIPRSKLKLDDSNNILVACRECNSSKSDLDLLEWMNKKEFTLPILVLRRYLKLLVNYCKLNDLMEMSVTDLTNTDIPFRIDLIPTTLPSPVKLILHY